MAFQIGSQNPDDTLTSDADPSFRMPLAVKAFGSGLFSGYSPIASGTVGTLVGLGLYAIPGFETPPVILTLLFVVFVLGIKAAGIMEKRYGHDPAEVTIDEILGIWISLVFLPKSIAIAIAGFLVFRIMDIVKPWPARTFDKTKGGFGIMMDDAVAGLYTNIVLNILFRAGAFDLLSLHQ